MTAIMIGITFILIFLFANHLIPTNRIKRLRWLSFSGGLAVSYVFVYVLPSLHKEQQTLQESGNQLTMHSELYFIGLIGLLIFYGIQTKIEQHDHTTTKSLIKLEIFFFTLYNVLIVYIVTASNVYGVQALFYGIAVGLHFIAVSHDLWRRDPALYNTFGRYVLTLGVVIGWAIGTLITLSSFTQSLIFAFISGAMILNVLKHELPKNQDAHFPTFATAVLSYTSITIALKYFFNW